MANKLLHPQKYHPSYEMKPEQDIPITVSDRQLIKRLEERVTELEEKYEYADKMVRDIINPMHVFMKEREIIWDGDVDTALLDYAKQLEERLAKLETSQDG